MQRPCGYLVFFDSTKAINEYCSDLRSSAAFSNAYFISSAVVGMKVTVEMQLKQEAAAGSSVEGSADASKLAQGQVPSGHAKAVREMAPVCSNVKVRGGGKWLKVDKLQGKHLLDVESYLFRAF